MISPLFFKGFSWFSFHNNLTLLDPLVRNTGESHCDLQSMQILNGRKICSCEKINEALCITRWMDQASSF
jgi:hypothetical protein